MITDTTAQLRSSDGAVTAGEQWCRSLDHVDIAVLDRAISPVLDIGCGPGRHVLALAERGALALGIDLTPHAVTLARDRGASVLERCVFGQLPGTGRWRTALLLDGNIGIGADAVGLLRRIATLLCADGRVLVELAPSGRTGRPTTARLELDGVDGPWFPWTSVGVDEIGDVAAATGFAVCERWRDGDRHFAQLCRCGPATP
jgi:SAM-dependent methyltransferase